MMENMIEIMTEITHFCYIMLGLSVIVIIWKAIRS